MNSLFVLFGLVAYFAAVSAECDALARIKCKSQWASAFGSSGQRTDLAAAIFRHLVNHDRSARALFAAVGSSDMESYAFVAHSLRVCNGLDRLISQLDHESVFRADLDVLKGQHASRGISAANYANMKTALLSVLPGVLGGCFDSAAWSGCIDVIEDGIVS